MTPRSTPCPQNHPLASAGHSHIPVWRWPQPFINSAERGCGGVCDARVPVPSEAVGAGAERGRMETGVAVPVRAVWAGSPPFRCGPGGCACVVLGLCPAGRVGPAVLWVGVSGYVKGVPCGVCRAGPLSDVVERRCATLPHPSECSTIAVLGLSFRVRNGTGRLPQAMTAANSVVPALRLRGGAGRGDGSGTGRWTRVSLSIACGRSCSLPQVSFAVVSMPPPLKGGGCCVVFDH